MNTSSETKAWIAAAAAKVRRTCGDCSLCCKLPYVRELNKSIDTWCPQCGPDAAAARSTQTVRPHVETLPAVGFSGQT